MHYDALDTARIAFMAPTTIIGKESPGLILITTTNLPVTAVEQQQPWQVGLEVSGIEGDWDL